MTPPQKKHKKTKKTGVISDATEGLECHVSPEAPDVTLQMSKIR